MDDEVARVLAKTRLSTLVGRIMADGEVDEGERESMRVIFRDADLSSEEVSEVFAKYVARLQAQVLADGDVSVDERHRCEALVDQLRVPLRLLPPEMLDIVLGKKR